MEITGIHEQQLVSAAQAIGLAIAGDYFEQYVGQVCISSLRSYGWLPEYVAGLTVHSQNIKFSAWFVLYILVVRPQLARR